MGIVSKWIEDGGSHSEALAASRAVLTLLTIVVAMVGGAVLLGWLADAVPDVYGWVAFGTIVASWILWTVWPRRKR